MKTVRPRCGGASFVLCDDHWRPVARWVWITVGPVYCWGRCRECGEWASVNDLRDVAGGGRWDSPTGLCAGCGVGTGAELR